MPATTADPPLSILHVAQPTDHGVAACVAALAKDQATRGWAVAVACPDDGPLPVRAVEAGAAHHRWPAVREPHRSLVAERRALAAAVAAARPDVVHLHSAKAGLSGRALLRGRVSTIFQPHAWSFEALDGRSRRLAVAWERLAARWVDAVVCCSEDEAASGRRAGIGGDTRVIANAVDLERFRPHSAEERRAVRRALGLSDGPLAVCIGRLSRQKGQDVLLAAWPQIRAAHPDATLALVGTGPAEEELRAQAGGRADIVFAGHRDDTPQWLAAADVAVLPSRYEGMALGSIEAIASGVSVVASAADGMEEVLGAGVDSAGAIVPIGDAVALADAVSRRFADPGLRDREGRTGRRRAETRHDRREWFDRFAALAQEGATSR